MRQARKHDRGKPPLALVPRRALELEALVMEHGRRKYGLHNWRQGEGLSRLRLLSAALRHIMADADGETLDAESGLPHLAHARCMLAFALEGLGKDDRHRPAVARRPKVAVQSNKRRRHGSTKRRVRRRHP